MFGRKDKQPEPLNRDRLRRQSGSGTPIGPTFSYYTSRTTEGIPRQRSESRIEAQQPTASRRVLSLGTRWSLWLFLLIGLVCGI